MRYFLALGLLVALSASANAASVHHPKSRLKSPPVSRQDFVVRPVPGLAYGAYAGPRPDIRYDDTPSYNDPSKWGGGAP